MSCSLFLFHLTGQPLTIKTGLATAQIVVANQVDAPVLKSPSVLLTTTKMVSFRATICLQGRMTKYVALCLFL